MATENHNLHIGELFQRIASLSSLADILELVRIAVVNLGANRTSYHFTPKLKSQTDHMVQLATYGFSREWLGLYEEPGFRQNDPIPDIVMQHGGPMLWHDALALRRLNENEERFASLLKAHDLDQGIGIPLYGPKGRHAYSAFTFDPVQLTYDEGTIATVAAIASAAHVRICNILDKQYEPQVHLSQRETQVIRLIAHGHSNKAIAADLDIGGSTADTYVRRVFAKLDASDRISASIRALELGILRL